MGLNAPFSFKLFSLCKNGHFEALEGRLNVIAPREASRNGGLGYANQPEPLGGETRYNFLGRSVALYFAPGELIGALCIAPPRSATLHRGL